ncbi:tetratricopeptide repeat protein [Bremerella alba]|uniref:Outer membrane protein assembly factor BamD n=1 Tax=Bremerella alba TaxID=980252 RepID=A0A7V8V7I0_9BACT|nr:tetratricopeptide repeat protein [Bremerella alba]MBA2116365.1 Outer membrane protein assembly factor BamD [Bremerella alba]
MLSLFSGHSSPSARCVTDGTEPCRRARYFFLAALLLLLICGHSVEGQESSQEAALFFSDVVNYQNAGEFELAADEWKKFVAKFPGDPLAAKAQNYLAVCQLQLKKYADATANFETVLKKYPQADFREEAMLNLASANYAWAQNGNQAKYKDSATRFSALLKEFPKTEFADQAQYFLGESLYLSGQKEQSIAAYEQLVKSYPKSSLAPDALYAKGVTLEELQKYSDAQKVYDQFLTAYSGNSLATEVMMRKGEALLQQSQFADAEKLFEQASQKEGFELADHAIYRLAYCALQRDELMKAGNAYARIPLNFSKSAYAPEATMLAGRCYYRAGRLDDAARWLAAAGRQGGQFEVEAAHWLARVYLQQGKAAEAEALAKAILPKAGSHEFLVDLKMDMADALYEQPQRSQESIALYERIAKDHPDTPEAPQALYNAAFAALETRDFAKASALSDQFAKKYPKDESRLDAMYVGAEAKLQTDKLADAEKALKTLIKEGKSRPEVPRWQLRLALTQYLLNKFADVEKTIASVQSSLKDADLLAQANYLVGASAFQQSQFDKAQKALEASGKASTSWAQADEARLMLARTLHAQGDTSTAIQQAQGILASYPNSQILDQVNFRLGEFLFAANRFDDAAAAYAQVLSQAPGSSLVPHALYGQAWAYLKQPDAGKAEQAFSELIAKHTGHELIVDAHTGRAISRRSEGKFKEAIDDLNQVISKSKDDTQKLEAEYLKGVSLVDAKNPAEAEKVFTAIHQQSPQFASDDKVLYELAWAQRAQGKGDAANASFQQLAKAHPQSPLAAEAMYHVGESYYAKDNFAESETWYASSANQAKAPEIGEKALYKQSWAQYQQGKTKEALDGFGSQITKFPNGPLASDAIFMQGECFNKDKQFDAALDSYGRVDPKRLSSDEMRSLLMLHAGQSASQQKLWAEAKKWFTQLVDQLPNSPLLGETYYELGWASYNEKKTPEAINYFDKAAEESRGLAGARARFMLGEIYFEQKKYDDALGQFKRVVYGFGGEKSLDSVKPWQAKCAYEIGRCNEVQIRQAAPADKAAFVEEAKKFYTLVAQRFPQASEAKLAQARLEALAQL